MLVGDLWIVTCFPLAESKPQEFLTRLLVHFIVGEKIHVNSWITSVWIIVNVFLEELLAEINLLGEVPFLILLLEAVSKDVVLALVLYICIPPFFQDLPMELVWVVANLAIRSRLIQVV